MERFPVSDPPTPEEFAKCSSWLKHFLHAEVRPQLLPALELEQKNGAVQLVGTGGTTSILARMEKKLDRFDRDHIESTVLTFDQLVAQSLLPRSVVVEHNGEAVAPSEFSARALQSGDRLEIVQIVAGG